MSWSEEVRPSGEEAADTVLPASADARQVAAAVASFLAQVPALDCIDPAASLPGAARVLVVEDNKVNQSLLAAALARRGFTTFVADNGEAAVRQAAAGSFDAILMDIQMPGIDGLEATRRIRAMDGRMATMPIIALSALTGAVVQKRCAEVGMTARAVKPVNLDRLAADLRRWIDEARTVLPAGETDAEPDDLSESTVADGTAEVSVAFLESMVLDVGLDRTRACIREFLSDLTARCSRLSELLPGWEADAIMRICHDLGGRAGELGAVGLAEAMEDLADQAERGERDDAARTIRRIEASLARTGASMTASLARLAQKNGEDGRQAA